MEVFMQNTIEEDEERLEAQVAEFHKRLDDETYGDQPDDDIRFQNLTGDPAGAGAEGEEDESWYMNVRARSLKRKQRKEDWRAKRRPRIAYSVPRTLPNDDRAGMEYPPDEWYDHRLHDILSMARPHLGESVGLFAQIFLDPYDAKRIDDAAYMVQVLDEDGVCPPVLFSCHIDTVHYALDGDQKIWFDPETKSYFKKDGAPLGGDDGAGVWLMLEMIDAAVPGVYLFHEGEERGGLGSSHMAENYSNLLRKFDMAVAFDRRGYSDVITHQGFSRTCSDEFAQALADALNEAEPSFMYLPDDTGIFTDTANYTGLIPECTNVSIGYKDEHTGWEELNVPHLFALRDAVIAVDWKSLPIHRVPRDYGSEDWYVDFKSDIGTHQAGAGRGIALGRTHGPFEEDEEEEGAKDPRYLRLYTLTREELTEMCYNDPEGFIDAVCEELGVR